MKEGVMDLSEEKKFDFITVGEALHFFPVEDSLKKIKSILNQNGSFVTLGYIPKKVTSKNRNQNEIFLEFERKITPFYTFDRSDLAEYYSDEGKFPF